MTLRVLLSGIILLGALHGQNNLTTTAHQKYFDVVRQNLESSADVMPADRYGFRLTDAQMTFAQWLIHATQRNYRDCATLQSVKTPAAEQQVANLKEKADVSKALKDSFAYCEAAMDKLTDQKAISSPEMSYAFLHVVIHNNEVYGNIVGYLRVSGIVPPSTAIRQKAAKKK
jgi:hypothetical protein